MKSGSQTTAVLTDEQQMLVQTCRRIVGTHPTRTPAPEHRVATDVAAWEALGSAGLHAVRHPDSGATLLDAVLVAEELAWALTPVPFVATQLAVEWATHLDQRSDLEAIGDGAAATMVLDHQLLAPGVSGYVLDPVPGGRIVGGAELGTACDGADLTRLLVRAHGGVAVEVSDVWMAVGLTLVAADLVGTMFGALDLAVDHAREREQFGRPIGSFQAVQQLLADQLVSVEAARSATWHAARTESLADARVAKAYASEVAREVCEATIQVFGGIGMTWECPAHLYLRRALLSRQLLGDESHQWKKIAIQLLDDADAAR